MAEDEHKGIAIIGLNKPQTKNAFSKSMVNNLAGALDVLTHDKNVRAIIIRSMLPDVFCAGADLKERATMTPQEVHRIVTALRNVFKSIENLPVPVISVIYINLVRLRHNFIHEYLLKLNNKDSILFLGR